jgi:hypothetical protein
MPILAMDEVHQEVTRRNGYRYQFTRKHHGADPKAAQWLPSLSLADEFSVFNLADEHELSDEDGRLYGILRTPVEGVQFLGTRDEQVAEFPVASGNEAWHGYPVYPLANEQATGRGGQAGRPAKAVFQKMEGVGLLSKQERKRLMKGKYA